MTDDRLTAELDAIRERYCRRRLSSIAQDLYDSAEDVPRLATAVEAALEVADNARPTVSLPPLDCTRACDSGDCDCSGDFRPVAWCVSPGDIRAAITRALLGEDGTDAAQA